MDPQSRRKDMSKKFHKTILVIRRVYQHKWNREGNEVLQLWVDMGKESKIKASSYSEARAT